MSSEQNPEWSVASKAKSRLYSWYQNKYSPDSELPTPDYLPYLCRPEIINPFGKNLHV